MKKEKIYSGTIKDFCEATGGDYELMMMKTTVIDAIRAHTKKYKISQRKLASMLPGLTQDRVSKMYRGLSGGMTLDKLTQVAKALNLRVTLTVKEAKSTKAA